MRICGRNLVNTMWFTCAISGSRLGLRYRLPTTEERIAFEAESIEIGAGNIYYSAHSAARLRFGRQIVVGIEPDCFADQDGDAVASDADHVDYREDWREIVVESGSIDDLVDKLAAVVFQKSVEQEGVAEKNSKKTSLTYGGVAAPQKKEQPA